MTEKDDSQTQQQEDVKQESNFQNFISSARREGKNNTPENLICAKLWKAQSAKKLTRINLIAETCYDGLEVWSDKLADLDLSLIDLLSKVSDSLSNINKILFSHNGWYALYAYSVPWCFPRDLESYVSMIKPWQSIAVFEHYNKNIPDMEELKIDYVKFSCCFCQNEILTIEVLENKSTIELFKTNYEGEIKKRNITFQDYSVPSIALEYIVCPKCQKNVCLTKGKAEGGDNIELRKQLEISLDESKKIRLIETHHFKQIPIQNQSDHFWKTTKQLSLSGSNVLVGLFTSWANPLVSRLEMKISQNISKSTWDTYFNEYRNQNSEDSGEKENDA